jgi:hypothetical protein
MPNVASAVSALRRLVSSSRIENSWTYDSGSLACALPLSHPLKEGDMFKISVFESRNQCRLVLEGKLVAPWTSELRTACEEAKMDLHERGLMVDLKHVTAISQEAENLLLELMKDGVAFRCGDVFAKHVLAQIARRLRKSLQETNK